jgi:hypothetical protein
VQSRFRIEAASIKLSCRDAYNRITFMNMFYRTKWGMLNLSGAQRMLLKCDIRNKNGASADEGVTFIPILVAVRSKGVYLQPLDCCKLVVRIPLRVYVHQGLMGEKGLMEEDWNDRSNWRKKII